LPPVPEPADAWRLAAPAKLNLWLHVVGRREDGFHELDTLMVLLDLADVMTARAEGDGFEVRGDHADDVPHGHDNLAWQGWTAGWEHRPPSGWLGLDKAVPAAAGLGGGSSDAAAAWRLARHLADGDEGVAGEITLAGLAAIGADVPYFAARLAAARVTGIGEQVATVGAVAHASDVVLVHPPFGLSTADVFGALTSSDWSTPDAMPGPGRNDLLAPALRLRPELSDVIQLVARAGGEPHLTGSGPTVFVLTDDPERADGVATRVERAGLAATRTRLRSEPASIERP
jgi:4-diphosphocytidyl-2-C-methyl-D-erythritol kinase